MSSILVDTQVTDQHIREDGTQWPMALVRGDQTVFADTATELVGHLIEGYANLPDTEGGNAQALVARWRTCVATASDVQALICADRAAEGTFDPAAESEEVLTALFSDKTVPVEGFDTWDLGSVPLVLVATDYEPYTERVAPTGNVLWIDPSDEVAFLHSLTNLGVIQFYTHDAE